MFCGLESLKDFWQKRVLNELPSILSFLLSPPGASECSQRPILIKPLISRRDASVIGPHFFFPGMGPDTVLPARYFHLRDKHLQDYVPRYSPLILSLSCSVIFRFHSRYRDVPHVLTTVNTPIDDDSNNVTVTNPDAGQGQATQQQAGKTAWTLLLYLTSSSEGCVGGETVFYPHDRRSAREEIAVSLETGMLLLHKHGDDCMLVSFSLFSFSFFPTPLFPLSRTWLPTYLVNRNTLTGDSPPI